MRSSSLRWVTLLSYVVLSSSFSPVLSGRTNRPRLFASTHVVPVDSDSTVQAAEEAVILADDKDFIKPLPDKRQYRALKLNNGLQVLLVSAPESDVEAGSIHVQAGHFNDERPGLAHFHEHMLFLGTEKYPSPEEYEKFLASNGGSSNAFTDMEDTNYYFSVTPSEEDGSEEQVSGALHGALDRLAQFFISPLFDEDMVDRELRAIDSEYRNSLTSDAWRNYQLLKGGSNPLHPFHKFGCGNYRTLTGGGSIVNSTHSSNMGTSPRGELLEFYSTYYQTYNMRLCVVSRASLDALQQSVQDTFGALPPSREEIPRRGRELQKPLTLFSTEHAQYSSPTSIVQAFSTNELGIIRETVPILESHALKISFAAPPLDDPLLKDSRPYRVISHILGHESPGSLHSLLNQEGWLTGLSSGIGIDTSDFSLFSLTLSLTPKGMREKDQVLEYIFQWIALLKSTQEDLLHAYHDELRKLSQVNFLYRENGDVTDFCSTAAELLFDYEPAQLLFGTSQAGDYDPIIGRVFMNRMTPENALITVVNSDIKDTTDWNTEPWYGAKYRNTKMSPEQLERWANPQEIDPRLHLPGLNEYIPSDFSLRCDEDKEPVDISEDNEELELEPPTLFLERPNLRMWFKMDRYWRVPKTYIRLSLVTPNVYRSPRTMTLNRIYQRVLQDDLNSFAYDASVAGCNYRVACVPSGYRISVKGYSEKLPFLLDTLTARMLSLIDELKSGDPSLQQKFLKAKEGLLRETKNYRLDTPYEVASYNARLLMEERVWYIQNYVAEMEGPAAEKNPLTMEECARVAEECLLGKSKAEALCLGNIDEKGAKKVADVIDDNFLKKSTPLFDVEIPTFRSMKFPTRAEAVAMFGPVVKEKSIPLIYQEVAFSEEEENNAAELVLQASCEYELGYEGVAILELISHMAYNSAYNKLRTEEQLGYIVSSGARKSAGGSWVLSTVVQSSVAEPSVLEDRMEAWLVLFRQELEEMDPESYATEAGAVVAQLLERDTKLSQEVGRVWTEIMMTESLGDQMKEPAFDRLELLAEELIVDDDEERQSAVELKQKVLKFFDKYFAADSPERRAVSSRVYSQKYKAAYEEGVGKPGILSDHADIFHLKQFLSTWPVVPYWAKQPSADR